MREREREREEVYLYSKSKRAREVESVCKFSVRECVSGWTIVCERDFKRVKERERNENCL